MSYETKWMKAGYAYYSEDKKRLIIRVFRYTYVIHVNTLKAMEEGKRKQVPVITPMQIPIFQEKEVKQ